MAILMFERGWQEITVEDGMEIGMDIESTLHQIQSEVLELPDIEEILIELEENRKELG